MKMSSKLLKDVVLYVVFLIIIGIVLFSSFKIPNFFNHFEEDNTLSKVINEYINDNKDIFVEKIEFENMVEVVTKPGNYDVKWFDKTTGEELNYNSFINDLNGFNNKIRELLELKYPNFISKVLVDNKDTTYYFKSTELVIYYYNYVIEPRPNEELFLVVNYNEIKDYLELLVEYNMDYENENGFKIDLNKKHIALTFDDGPGKYTSDLVNYLNDGFAHATFFMQGSRLNNYSDAVKDVYNSGSEIAYHSYAHKYFTKQSINDIKTELNKSNKVLESIIGIPFSLVRPPYGSINDEVKEALNMPIILWNVDTEDWKNKDSDYLTNYVLNNIDDGDIVLFHDIHETSVNAIPNLLNELYIRGYQVVTISELASIANINLEAGLSYRYLK